MELAGVTKATPDPKGGQLLKDANGQPTGLPSDQTGQFVAAILGSADVQWKDLLAKQNVAYRPPRLVMFRGATSSACGAAQSAMGPFYCPNDREVYLDTAFFDELSRRFHGCDGKACEFARAYVIAHEIGHHVQNLTGTLSKIDVQRQQASEAESNRLSVRIELQADCYAGIWAHYASTVKQESTGVPYLQPLSDKDIQDALSAAASVGDDRIQKETTGRVNPESWTHGSAAQRQKWFTAGYQSGDPHQCDTFAATNLG